MRTLRYCCCLCILIVLTDSLWGQSISFRNDVYETALETAQREDKLVFIDTWAEWCGPCKKMEPVFRDPEVANYMNNNFVNVRIDMGKESEIKKKVRLKYDVFFLPTLLIVDKFGEVMFRADNKILSTEEFINIARAMHAPQAYVAAQPPTPPQATTDSRLIDESKTVNKIAITDDMMLTTSATTGATVLVPRPDINDPDYSDDPNEKILYTLGAGDDLPPEILYEEAYFRFSQLSDGSHKETVDKYLASQEDWTTEKNVKFIADFIMNTDTEQFDFLVNNRALFESVIGSEKVQRSLGILVFQKMYQAIDRPDLKDAERLLSYVDPATSKAKANQYILNRLLDQGKKAEFVDQSLVYLKKINPRDMAIAKKLAYVLDSQSSIDKSSLNEATKCIARITDQLKDYEMQHVHALLLHKKGKSSKAKDMATQAIESAKQQGKDFQKTANLLAAME